MLRSFNVDLQQGDALDCVLLQERVTGDDASLHGRPLAWPRVIGEGGVIARGRVVADAEHPHVIPETDVEAADRLTSLRRLTQPVKRGRNDLERIDGRAGKGRRREGRPGTHVRPDVEDRVHGLPTELLQQPLLTVAMEFEAGIVIPLQVLAAHPCERLGEEVGAPALRDLSHSGSSGGPRFSSGQGQNRTADTRIFSPLLYQLSYLAGQCSRRT